MALAAPTPHPQASDADGRELLLQLVDVVVTFGGIRALDEVTLQVSPGEVLGLIGPNGAGKTTLFDVIAGTRPPDAGQVLMDGQDITRMPSVKRARRGIGRTFQRVQTFGWLTVEDNVLAATEWHGGGGGLLADLVAWPGRRQRERVRRERARGVLRRCGLERLQDELAGSLPIGTARMVEVARAIAGEPRLLLLDEPASGLDGQEHERLGTLIRSVRDETGCAILLVEHDASFVMSHCDRVVVLNRGRVLAEGSPEEIQRDQQVRDAYLGDVMVEG